jgi:peptide/nickel transport system substrate-binding protein
MGKRGSKAFFRRAGFWLLPVFGILAGSCSNPNLSPPDTITTVVDGPLATLNPLYTTDAAAQHVNELLHATLVASDANLLPVPYLAEEFHYEGEKAVVFRLRKGCRFENGRAITSDDIQRSLDFYRDPANASPFAESSLKNISRFDRIDELSFRLVTDKVSPSLVSDLELLKVLQLDGIRPGDRLASLPGAGPYRLARLNSSSALLERSGQPCLPLPPMPKIAVKVVRDELSAAMKLKNGEVDIVINELNYRKVQAIDGNPSWNLNVLSADGVSYSYLGLNLASPRLRDKRVREALALSLDIPALIQYKSRGMAVPARNLLADLNFYSNRSVPLVKRDLSRSRELLGEAGYFDGKNGKPPLHLVLKTNSGIVNSENARVLVAQAKEAGIELEHQAFDWGIFYDDVKKGNTEVYEMRWVGAVDPRIYYENFHSGAAGRNNRTHYENPEMDKLLDQEENTLDPVKRKAFVDKVQELVARDLPYISLWHAKNVAVFRKNLQNVSLHPKGSWRVLLSMKKE